MFRDLSVVEKYVELKEGKEKILKAVQRPFLLLDKNSSPDDLDGISPGLGNVGVYLPYPPLRVICQFPPLCHLLYRFYNTISRTDTLKRVLILSLI